MERFNPAPTMGKKTAITLFILSGLMGTNLPALWSPEKGITCYLESK